MTDKTKENKKVEEQRKDSTLEPCDKPHTMETSRSEDNEEACDEGVK